MAGSGKRRALPLVLALALPVVTLAIGASPSFGQQEMWPRSPIRDPQHITQYRIWTWKELRDRNVSKQDRDYSCGAASLCTLLQYYWGDHVTEQMVLDKLDSMLTPAERKDRIKNGVSLTDLRRVSVKFGYVASIGTVSFEQLSQSKIPVIVGLKVETFDHFAVFRGSDWYWVYLADPARGNIRVPVKDFVEHWQKNAILVVAKKDQDLKENAPLSLRPEESYLGTLNRVEIQKTVARPIIFVPPVLGKF